MIIRGGTQAMTWAAARAARTTFVGDVLVTDLGAKGTMCFCNGVDIVTPPVLTLYQKNIPHINIASGTTGANGAVTTPGLPGSSMGSGKCYLYLPAGKAYAGSIAGFYYTELSSTTAGIIYDNMSNGLPEYPVTPTPIVSASIGAWTNTTAADMTSHSIVLPGGLLGKNGSVEVQLTAITSTNVNNKVIKANLDTFNFLTLAQTTVTGFGTGKNFYNMNDEARQVTGPTNASQYSGTSGTSVSNGAIDTTVDKLLTISLRTSATSTDFMILSALKFLVYT